MRISLISVAVGASLLTGCAGMGGPDKMSGAQLAECLQPNRRVVVEVGGLTPKPVAKKPGEAAPAKPAKPSFASSVVVLNVQGNSAFDSDSAVLKAGGKQDIDKFLAGLTKKSTKINSVVVSGHIDRLEAAKGENSLDEERAKAVKEYLVAKGVGQQSIFWEGKDSKYPVAVTKFCE